MGHAEFFISVIVVNWNSSNDLRDCLQSLGRQNDHAFEVIVVDNGSTDGSIAMVEHEFPTVRLVQAGDNLGFAEGCNRGIAIARGDWIALLNNDAVADSNWLLELRKQVAMLPKYTGMLQSKMLFKSDPTHVNSAGLLLFENATVRDRFFGEPDRGQTVMEEIFAPTAGAALYHRNMLEEVRQSTGVFDRAFFMYFEDVDLGWRCRLAGWRSFYVPTSVVLHGFQQSSKRQTGDFFGWHCRKNRLRSLMKNASLEFFVASLPKTMLDALWVLRQRGILGLRDFLSFARAGLTLRKEVAGAGRVSRHAVERTWVTRR
jgi:GT2 family glycosyltransferase